MNFLNVTSRKCETAFLFKTEFAGKCLFLITNHQACGHVKGVRLVGIFIICVFTMLQQRPSVCNKCCLLKIQSSLWCYFFLWNVKKICIKWTSFMNFMFTNLRTQCCLSSFSSFPPHLPTTSFTLFKFWITCFLLFFFFSLLPSEGISKQKIKWLFCKRVGKHCNNNQIVKCQFHSYELYLCAQPFNMRPNHFHYYQFVLLYKIVVIKKNISCLFLKGK